MIVLSNLFMSYIPCFIHKNAKIVDGMLSSVTSQGFVKILDKLVLNFILYVLDLSCNLIFMSKLTYDLNFVVKFFPAYCDFQNHCIGKRIKSGRGEWSLCLGRGIRERK